MSWSTVQICNMALAKAGSTVQIQALEYADGQTVPEEARQCSMYWDLVVDATGRAGNFSCLRKPAEISANLSAVAIAGYGYEYSLPADYLGWPSFPEDAKTDFQIVGKVLHTDRAVTQMVYAARPASTDLFDPLFVEALVLRLAAYLSTGPVGGNDQRKAESLGAWLERVALPIAEYVNSGEVPPPVVDGTSWREARL